MGFGLPAAIAAQRLFPARTVVCFAGDGDFLMNGQEFATAVQYGLPVIVVLIDNGMYGTIRMHQERMYPERVIATALRNPDFAAYARAFGGHGETVQETAEFLPAVRTRFGFRPAFDPACQSRSGRDHADDDPVGDPRTGARKKRERMTSVTRRAARRG